MVGRGGRVKLTEVNPHLVCVLCRGYLIDATTITECLHSFCRSCIILYLETKSYCPICEVQIHKTKPYLNLKLDKTLQDIVYKLVPGLFHSEMRRRQEFYKKYPLHDLHLHPEARGVAIDRLIYSPDDSISLSLEYYDLEREREEWTSVADAREHASKRKSSRTNIPPATETQLALSVVQPGEHTDSSDNAAQVEQAKKRYLLCPAVVTMVHLKKFVRNKYNLPDTTNVEIIYRRESLPDSYSLMDVAYIYTWKQNEPMKFYYRIHLMKCVQSLSEKEEVIENETVKSDVLESETKLKLSVNCAVESNKPDMKREEITKIGSPLRLPKKSEAYSLDEEEIEKSKISVPNQTPVKSKLPVSAGIKNGQNPDNKNDEDLSKVDSKPQETLNFKSKFYQDPSRNILPYKSKARSTVPSEHFPSKLVNRSKVSNSNLLSKNKSANRKSVPSSSPRTTSKPSNTNKNKRCDIPPSRSVTLRMNIANTIVAETNTFKTPLIANHSIKNEPCNTKLTKEDNVQLGCNPDKFSSKSHPEPKTNTVTSTGVSLPKPEHNKSIISITENGCPVDSTSSGVESNSMNSPPQQLIRSPSSDQPKQAVNNQSINKSLQKLVTPLKIVVQQETSPDKCINKSINTNDIKRGDVKKLQENSGSEKNNIPEDIKKSFGLDKAAEELLLAVGLKPKTDVKEPIQTVDKMKEESSKENVSPDQKKIENEESSDFSAVGFGLSRPFRSEHEEMSVNLLLSLSNGHASVNHTPSGDITVINDKDSTKKMSETDIPKLPQEQKNQKIESPTTAVDPKDKTEDNTPSTLSKDDSPDKERLITKPLLIQVNGSKVSSNHNIDKKDAVAESKVVESPMSSVPSTAHKETIQTPKSSSPEKVKVDSTDCITSKLEPNLTPSSSNCDNPQQKKSTEESAKVNTSPKVSTTFHQIHKNNVKQTKDISKTVDLLLMKSLSASKETVIPEVVISESDVSVMSVSSSKIDEKRVTDCTAINGKEEAAVKPIAALARTRLTGQTEVTSTEMASPISISSDTEDNEQDSKVRMLKRKLNRPGDCDVHVSTATRDDGLTESKRRRLVTPDVSIELLTGPVNERTANKRPSTEFEKFCAEKKPKMSIESGDQDELKITNIDHLAVKIEKVAQRRLNFPPLSVVVKQKLVEKLSGKNSPEPLRPKTPKNSVGDRCDSPNITIEKMSERKTTSPPIQSSNGETNKSENVVKCGLKSEDTVAGCSPVLAKTEIQVKSGLSSPTEPSTSPSGQKKMPKLIEINAPPRSKSEALLQDKKTNNQRTGLKMTTVRKEVPIGRQMPFMKRDCNGALDLSPASVVAKPRPTLPLRTQTPFGPPVSSEPVDMFSAAALHQMFKQQLQLQGRLLASQANNNNMSRDYRKDPELSKRLEDWVRNAISCGALPPHPLMFGQLSQQQQPQQQQQQQQQQKSPTQRSNSNISSTP